MERRWKVLAVVSVAVFVVGLDMFIVNIAFPKIEQDFSGSSVSGISWVLSAYAIVLAALMVPAGRIADRIGRRRGFLTGLVVFTIGSALCGAAPSVPTLVLARVIQAAGASLLLPTSLALLLPEFAPAERPMAIGIWSAVGAVAAAAGPPIGGLLVHFSWRLVFLVNLPIGAIALVYAARVLRESRADAEARPDLLGGLLLMVAIGLLALGLVKAPDWGWASAATIASLAGAGVGIMLFWWRCLVHPSPSRRPGDAPRALVRLRQLGIDRIQRRVRRDAPRQRAVPDRRLALLRPACRGGADARPGDGRRDGRAGRPARGAVRTTHGGDGGHHAVRSRWRVVAVAPRRDTVLRQRDAARPDHDRYRRRPDDSLSCECSRRVAAPGPLCDRLGRASP